MIFEQLGVTNTNANDRITLTELLPADLQKLSAVSSVRENINPKPFTFDVPIEAVLVGIRLEGSCVLTSRKWGTSHLIQPGDVYLLADGKYDAIFGRRRSNTLFMLADRPTLVGLDYFQREHRGHIPVTSIDTAHDPIMAKVAAIQDCTSKHSYFKFNALLSEILYRLNEREEDKLLRYGIAAQDEPFTHLCEKVIDSPKLDWTTILAAEETGYSVYHFSRTFRAKTGIGFHEFVCRVRAIKAVDLICQTGSRCPSLLEQVGLHHGPAANKVIQRELGLTLADIRRVLAPKVAAVAS